MGFRSWSEGGGSRGKPLPFLISNAHVSTVMSCLWPVEGQEERCRTTAMHCYDQKQLLGSRRQGGQSLTRREGADVGPKPLHCKSAFTSPCCIFPPRPVCQRCVSGSLLGDHLVTTKKFPCSLIWVKKIISHASSSACTVQDPDGGNSLSAACRNFQGSVARYSTEKALSTLDHKQPATFYSRCYKTLEAMMWKMKSIEEFPSASRSLRSIPPARPVCCSDVGYTIPGELGYGLPAVRLDGVGCRLTAMHQLSNRVSPVVAQGVLNR